MPLSVKDLQTPLTLEQVKEVIVDALTSVLFPVEAWQPNGAARSFIEAQAAVAVEQSQSVASIAAMTFLQTSVGDFLDHLSVSHYDELRQQANRAIFDLNFVNQGGTSYGPLAAGAITVKATNGQTFKNSGIETIVSLTTTVVEVIADFAGSLGNIPPGTLELVTPLAGVVVTFGGTYTTAGSDTESDVRYRERDQTKWATLRVERVAEGFRNLARNAAPAVIGVILDDDNPRGPGTANLYLAALNATAGGADVIAVQAALDLAVFGNNVTSKLVLAIAAPTQTINLSGTVFYQGVNDTDLRNGLELAWTTFLNNVPIGGYDFSPGPANVIMASQIITTLKTVPGVISVNGVSDFVIALNTKAILGTIALTRVPVNVS